MKYVLAIIVSLFAGQVHAVTPADYARENPQYVQMWDGHDGGFFVVLSQTTCGPCRALISRMRSIMMPVAVIEIDTQPHTAANYPGPAQTPTVYWLQPRAQVGGVWHRAYRRVNIEVLP